MKESPSTNHVRIEGLDRCITLLEGIREQSNPKFRFKLSKWLVSAIVPVGILIGGYLLNSLLERKADEITNLERVSANVENAVADFRKTIQILIIECESNQGDKKALQSIRKSRIDAEYALLEAAIPIKYYFGTAARREVSKFLVWINSLSDVCTLSSSIDNDIQLKANAMIDSLSEQINKRQSEYL